MITVRWRWGLWAPTLRFHQGRFYLINTFVSEGLHEKRMNYIVTAENPAGPWSDPVVVEACGWHRSESVFRGRWKMWYIGNFICQPEQKDGHHGIIYLQQDRSGDISVLQRAICSVGSVEYRHREMAGGTAYLSSYGTGTI
ncbi:MAG: family 43 glycosylhydrolase [Waltera sp.]